MVVIFHTSLLGVQEHIADVDILVNGGSYQPGCEYETSATSCSHYAAFILRELIILRSTELRRNSDGLVVAINGQGDEFVINFTNPPYGKIGVYNMTTGMIFETKTTGFFGLVTKGLRLPGCF